MAFVLAKQAMYMTACSQLQIIVLQQRHLAPLLLVLHT